MAEVDKSTLQEVDLDQAFDGNGKEVEKSKDTKPDKDQAVDFDVNEFLRDMDAELRDKPKPEKEIEKVEPKEDETKNEPQEEVESERRSNGLKRIILYQVSMENESTNLRKD